MRHPRAVVSVCIGSLASNELLCKAQTEPEPDANRDTYTVANCNTGANRHTNSYADPESNTNSDTNFYADP